MSFAVAKYTIEMYSGDIHAFRSKIHLVGAKFERAQVNFTDTHPLPASSRSGGSAIHWYPFDAFAPMMEMLREEKPVWVFDWGSGMSLSSSDQPPGEDQGP